MKRLSLNDDWYVYPRDDAFSLVTAIPDDAVHTSVPYDALLHEGQRPDSVNAGRTSHFDGQVYYFQRELVLDEALRGMRLLLKFEAVFSKSFVYVNGSQVGMGDFGYTSLTCDITSYVRWDAPNTLLVVCKTDLLSSRWYAGCGIVRPVWLMYGPQVHTEPDSIWLTTQELTPEGGARVRLRATLRNYTGVSQNVNVRLRVFDADEVDVLDEVFPVRVGECYELDRALYLRHSFVERGRPAVVLDRAYGGRRRGAYALRVAHRVVGPRARAAHQRQAGAAARRVHPSRRGNLGRRGLQGV